MSAPDYTREEAWNERYTDPDSLRAPGTFEHTERGNRLFYRVKCAALDRCLRFAGTALKDQDVLDAAGGTGCYVEYYLGRGARGVTVADFSSVAIRRVQDRFEHDSRVVARHVDLSAKVHDWTGMFDWVFMLEAIFLLPDDAALRMATENLGGALRPGGHIVISDIFPEGGVRRAGGYITRRSKRHFEALLGDVGISVLGYVPQTFLFNRRVFGPAQSVVEHLGPLMAWLDGAAMHLGFQAPRDIRFEYLIGRRK
jgi:SAM-dependent methyltransferase